MHQYVSLATFLLSSLSLQFAITTQPAMAEVSNEFVYAALGFEVVALVVLGAAVLILLTSGVRWILRIIFLVASLVILATWMVSWFN